MACNLEEDAGTKGADAGWARTGASSAPPPPPSGTVADEHSRTTLGKIPGLVYPNPTYFQTYHLAHWIYMFAFAFTSFVTSLVPSGTWDSMEPPPAALTVEPSVERRWRLGQPFFFVLPLMYMLVVISVAPLRPVLVQMFFSFWLMFLGLWFCADISPVYALTFLVYPTWSWKFNEQPVLAFILAYGMGILSYLYFQAIMLFQRFQAMMPNELLAGAVAPVSASMFVAIMKYVPSFFIERFARPGVAPSLMAMLMTFILLVGDTLRLTGMTASEGLVDLASSFVCNSVAEIITRSRAVELLIDKLWYKEAQAIQPRMDLLLRLKFTMTYVPVVAAISHSVWAAIAGAPWARTVVHWMAYLVYFASAAAVDLMITAAHRHLYPVAGEGLFATLLRLSAQPRAHWPSFQPGDAVARRLWAPSALAKRFKTLTDDDFGVVWVMQMAYLYAFASFRAFYGECYIDLHPDNC